MKITFKGNPVTLVGNDVKVGDSAPDFVLTDASLQRVTIKDTHGKRIFVVVPSIDTPVCDREVRKFNEEASSLKDVTVYVISMDLPFAQSRWCGAEGIENVKMLSVFREKEFGPNYGVYIQELGLLARAVFVIDEKDNVVYSEYCEEVSSDPNYEAALEAVKKI